MTITELNRKQTAYKNKLKKIERFVNAFQAIDGTKDYIELTSKLNSINDILKELDNLQNEFCALPDKIELNNSLEILSDMEEDAEKFKVRTRQTSMNLALPSDPLCPEGSRHLPTRTLVQITAEGINLEPSLFLEVDSPGLNSRPTPCHPRRHHKIQLPERTK
ncbi:hypothetical protein AVEN_49931-1 [Araneus ventricosus]|uniref:Uncharacterized protein n=1 Tax=Araneus ventricosus TaxID=182803 RepID=A0A4Y1ZPV6_ARAVE|nr:hypothetical protein AVEN_49931-1 [Araneus ventricosus]